MEAEVEPPSSSPSSSFLLTMADDMVKIFQNLVTVLSDFLEDSVSNRDGPSLSSCMWSLEAVKLTCHELHQKLAVMWPCQKQFVAVLGQTGCGKSTLLNLLLSMMAKSGDAYAHGIKADSVRAVLRDTARFHGSRGGAQSEAGDEAEVLPCDFEDDNSYMQADQLVGEQISFDGLLGFCCAQDKASYMSKHFPNYDAHPFILRTGRMGDAGTTKVTAIVYGPKFVGHIQWMTRKKLRKKLRDLRQLLDKSKRTVVEDERLAELKEFWACVRQLVNLPSSAEKPSEEQINMMVDACGSKRKLLDKTEVIETKTSQGYTIDRVVVREGIKKKLGEQLGKLIEDLRIEVPVSSFEGGISLLDVPGTNDPRVLHQRETRDAIDRTSLILLVLDKSVMDDKTEKFLTESLLLERMLMDSSAQCGLVVVGIAEKVMRKGQSPKELLAGFDPQGTILKTLRKIFLKIASRLCKSKRLEKDHALSRVESLFSSSITLIPVLPFLCASIHLSVSNAERHQNYCGSQGLKQCPLMMSKDAVRERCIETNVPCLLEKLHSVRVPPTREELNKFMNSTIEGLNLLTQESLPDNAYVEFLQVNWDQAVSVAAEDVCIGRHVDVSMELLNDKLKQYADECKLMPPDIQEICNTIGEEVLSQLQTGQFSLGPYIVRGFCPEAIGQKANMLIQSVDEESKGFIEEAYDYLVSLRGNAVHVESLFDKVSESMNLPLAVGLHEQLNSKWKLSLQRLRAKCFCGGMDGGLLGHVREALRKAYSGALKHLMKELKWRSKSTKLKEAMALMLEGNEIGKHAAKVAKSGVEDAIKLFWKNLLELTNSEMQFLWRSWQIDSKNLAESASMSRHAYKQISSTAGTRENMQPGDERLKVFQAELRARRQELVALNERLLGVSHQPERDFDYGYGLFHSGSYFSEADRPTRLDNVALDMPMERERCSRTVKCNLKSAHLGKQGLLKDSCMHHANISPPQPTGAGSVDGCPDNPITNKEDALLYAKISPRNRRGDGAGSIDGSRDNPVANKEDALVDANISPRYHRGDVSSCGQPHMVRLGSYLGRRSRKAQVLSEDESHKLQRRESSAGRARR